MRGILALTGFIYLLNLPFGYWRAGLRKLSPAWFVAIHAPVGIIVLARLAAGMPFRLVTLPLYVLSFFLGQATGARWRPPAAAAP